MIVLDIRTPLKNVECKPMILFLSPELHPKFVQGSTAGHSTEDVTEEDCPDSVMGRVLAPDPNINTGGESCEQPSPREKPCSIQEQVYVSELDKISSESDWKQGHYVVSTILENDEHDCTSAENLDDEGSTVQDYLQGRSYDVILALSEEYEEWMSEIHLKDSFQPLHF
jgi:hypothetical protein